jgi:D-tyrosyl-tRNA(Tyr) deacylase
VIALLQRVSSAGVVVEGALVGAIDAGLMVLVCAERDDSEREADALLTKLLGYRVFSDEAGKMNRSVADVGGGLLLVPQFTLAADTRSGTRPSFYARRAARRGPAPVRPFRRGGAPAASGGGHRRVRRRHEGQPDQ